MSKETGVDDGPSNGHDTECREEGEALEPERWKAVHGTEDATTNQSDIETLRAQGGVGNPQTQGGHQ